MTTKRKGRSRTRDARRKDPRRRRKPRRDKSRRKKYDYDSESSETSSSSSDYYDSSPSSSPYRRVKRKKKSTRYSQSRSPSPSRQRKDKKTREKPNLDTAPTSTSNESTEGMTSEDRLEYLRLQIRLQEIKNRNKETDKNITTHAVQDNREKNQDHNGSTHFRRPQRNSEPQNRTRERNPTVIFENLLHDLTGNGNYNGLGSSVCQEVLNKFLDLSHLHGVTIKELIGARHPLWLTLATLYSNDLVWITQELKDWTTVELEMYMTTIKNTKLGDLARKQLDGDAQELLYQGIADWAHDIIENKDIKVFPRDSDKAKVYNNAFADAKEIQRKARALKAQLRGTWNRDQRIDWDHINTEVKKEYQEAFEEAMTRGYGEIFKAEQKETKALDPDENFVGDWAEVTSTAKKNRNKEKRKKPDKAVKTTGGKTARTRRSTRTKSTPDQAKAAGIKRLSKILDFNMN